MSTIWKNPSYESPNIVIVPTVSFICNNNTEEPSAKKQKLETCPSAAKPSTNLIPPTSSYIPQVSMNEESKKIDVNSIKKEIKVNSWASNYLNSIGMNTKPIKMNLSISKNKILEKLAKIDKRQEDSVEPIEIDTSKDNIDPRNVIKINTTGCDASGSKPVEDNVNIIKKVVKINTNLNTNNIATNSSNYAEPQQTTKQAIDITPSGNYPQNIEPTYLNTFNTTNKRKYDEYLNPVPHHYNTDFHSNESAYAQNNSDYTYYVIEKQLFEMEKGSQYLSQSSTSASMNYNLPKSDDIYAKSDLDKDPNEPKVNNIIIDPDKKFKDRALTPEINKRSRFDSVSSHSDVKKDERESNPSKVSSKKYRSDSKSPYKKINKTNKTSKPTAKHKKRSYSPTYDKQSERYSSSSKSYKNRNYAKPKTSKYTSEKNSKDKPTSNYDKEKKTDKERYHEERKKSSKSKIRRSRTPEREQNKRPRTNSENFEKKSKTKNINSIKSVVQPSDNYYEKHHVSKTSKSHSPEPFDLRSKLSRTNKYQEQCIQSGSTEPIMEKNRDKLLVTINQPKHDEQKAKAPSKIKVTEKKSKGKKFKTIQFTIKVLCEESDGSSSVSEDSGEVGNSEDDPGVQRDLSFLDDFNVDEIVDSLKHTRRNAQKGKNTPKNIEKTLTNKQVENCSVTLEFPKKEDNVKVEKKLHDESQDCIVLDESDVKIKQEQIDSFNKSDDCVILDTVPPTNNIIGKQINNQNRASKNIKGIKTKPSSSNKNNESNDCVFVDPTETEKIEIKQENINESNDCIILEPSIENIKIETDSLNENTSNDCIIVDPVNTKNIKMEVKMDDDKNNNSDDCIIIDSVEPIKIEPNNNKIERPHLDSMEVNESTHVDKNGGIKVKDEAENKYVNNEITSTISDDVLNIPLPNSPFTQTTNANKIKQEIIDENAPVGQNTNKFNAMSFIDNLIQNTSSVNSNSEHAKSSNFTNGKGVTLSDPIKEQLIDNSPFKSTSENQNHEEAMNDTTYDSDASTVKLEYDSDDEETEVLKMKDIIMHEETESKVIEVTVPMEDNAKCKSKNSPKSKALDPKPKSPKSKTVGIETNVPNKEVIPKNKSKPETPSETDKNVQIIHEIKASTLAMLKPKGVPIAGIDKSIQKEASKTEIAKSNQKEASKTEITKLTQDEAPKTEITKLTQDEAPKTEITKLTQEKGKTVDVKSTHKETPIIDNAKSTKEGAPKTEIAKSSKEVAPKTEIAKLTQEKAPKTVDVKSTHKETPIIIEIAKSTQEGAPKTEISKSSKEEAPKTENAKSNPKEAPKTEIIKTNPKNQTEETENRQVTIVRNDEIHFSEYNETKQKIEERMFEYLQDSYTIISLIHMGRFSNIYKCQDSKKKNYAVKMITDQANRLSLGVEKELILQELQRDIPKENIYTVFMIDSFGIGRHWAFLMDYYATDLKTVLNRCSKPFSISQVQDLAGQLITAVMVLRNNNIIHSDIKPAHILMNESRVKLKLCGFDSSYYVDQVNLLPNIGTMAYRAPEVIVGFSASFGIDVWSTAVVLFEMATKRKLFGGIYNNQVLFNQLCLFGDMPPDMIQRSVFRANHFNGMHFMKRFGYRGMNSEIVYKFHKTPKFYKLLFSAYDQFWKFRTVADRANDLVKMYGFFKLLQQMLVIDPRKRLKIEFICTDPFITDMAYT